jgi:hypothetical protein
LAVSAAPPRYELVRRNLADKLLHEILISSAICSTKSTETDHFRSIDFHEPDLKWELIAGWAVPAYGAISMAAWNFSFPTTTERLLWRISAIINLAVLTLGSPLVLSWQNRSTISRWPDTLL